MLYGMTKATACHAKDGPHAGCVAHRGVSQEDIDRMVRGKIVAIG